MNLNSYIQELNEQQAVTNRFKAKKPTTHMWNNGISALGSTFESGKEVGEIFVQELSAIRKSRARQLLLDDIDEEVEFQLELATKQAELSKKLADLS